MITISVTTRHTATITVRPAQHDFGCLCLEHMTDCALRDAEARRLAALYGALLDIEYYGLKVRFKFIDYGPQDTGPRFAAEEFAQWLEDSGKWQQG